MGTVLALLVAIGFIWSVMLFFAAVFIRERRQEAGFGWALGGAALFLVVFADRLPGRPMGLRDVLTVLPGVPEGRQLFASSMLALVLLFVFYVFRIAVFYRLFIEVPGVSTKDNSGDIINDYVAPTLSYLCFAICLISLLQPLYELGPIATVLLALFMVFAYYWGILPRLLRYIQDLITIFVVLAARLRRAISRAIVLAIVGISRAEELRRADSPGGVSNWARDRLNAIDEENEAAWSIESEILGRTARRLLGRKNKSEGEQP